MGWGNSTTRPKFEPRNSDLLPLIRRQAPVIVGSCHAIVDADRLVHLHGDVEERHRRHLEEGLVVLPEHLLKLAQLRHSRGGEVLEKLCNY